MRSTLHDLLRAGGYILYARHGEAIVGEDLPNLNFKYCSTQRNLSELGRRQAIYYGQILRNLQIPIRYPVLASPFCRTVETAQLAFGRENVIVDPFWLEVYKLSEKLSASEKKRILNALQLELEINPPPGTNKVIIDHSFPKGIGLGEIPNMGTVIIKPLGPGKGYKIMDRLSLENFYGLR